MDCYLQIIAQMHAAHVETQLQLKVKENRNKKKNKNKITKKRVNWMLCSLATLNALIEMAKRPKSIRFPLSKLALSKCIFIGP